MNVEKFQALEQIRMSHPDKKLLPEEVVQAAKDPTSPLHGDFTWDDSEAASKYREQEARQVIRCFLVFEPKLQRNARAYVSLPSDRATGGGYRSLPDVLENDGWLDQLVQEVKTKLMSMKCQYRHLPQLDPLFARLEAEALNFLLEKKQAA